MYNDAVNPHPHQCIRKQSVRTLTNANIVTLDYESNLAVNQLRKALDAFARLDVNKALEV